MRLRGKDFLFRLRCGFLFRLLDHVFRLRFFFRIRVRLTSSCPPPTSDRQEMLTEWTRKWVLSRPRSWRQADDSSSFLEVDLETRGLVLATPPVVMLWIDSTRTRYEGLGATTESQEGLERRLMLGLY